MKLTVFIVIDSKFEEPELFVNNYDSFNFIKDTLIEHGKKYGYEEEEIKESIKELEKSYINDEPVFFEGILGERQLTCYRKEIKIKFEEC